MPPSIVGAGSNLCNAAAITNDGSTPKRTKNSPMNSSCNTLAGSRAFNREKAHNALEKRLRATLSNQHPERVNQLAQGLLNSCNVPECNRVIQDMLHANSQASSIMMALLHCQPILFHIFADHDDPQSWRDLISRFYRLQDLLIEEGDAMNLGQSEPAPSADRDSIPSPIVQKQDDGISATPQSEMRVCSNPDFRAPIGWLANQEKVRVCNHFRGVLINAYCELYQLNQNEDIISLELNQELGRVLAADPSGTHAILVGNAEADIGFSLELLDHHAGFIRLKLHPPQPLYIDQRDNLDVQPQEVVRVEIRRMTYLFPIATLTDFSANGIGLLAPYDDRVQFKRNDTLNFKFQIGTAAIRADGTIRGLTALETGCQLGVKLRINRSEQSKLQREVFRVQREIIVALNQEELAGELAADIR